MQDLKLLFPFNFNQDHSNSRKIQSYTKFGFIENGKEKLDLALGSAGCFLLGFDRFDIIDHVNQKLKENPFAGGEYMTTNQSVIELTEKLYQLSGGYRSVFSLSGSDAVETAIKLSMMYHVGKGAKRHFVIGFKNSYHGSTYLTSSIGSLEYMTKYINPSRNCITLSEKFSEDELLDEIDKIGHLSACLIMETCSWSKGLRSYSKSFLLQLREICKKHDIVFVLDDIATCGGKIGKFFGFDQDLRPDLFTVGKAFTGGYYPLSGCLVNENINDVVKNMLLLHGFTYSFSLSGIYSALKYIDILESENHLFNYHKVLSSSLITFNLLKEQNIILDYRHHGLIFDLDIKSTTEQTFYDHGLNIGVWNNGENNLTLVVPLNADARYFSMLTSGLQSVYCRSS